MKKLLLIAAVAMLLMYPDGGECEVMSSFGVGMMAEDGESPSMVYFVGMSIPVITDTIAGYGFAISLPDLVYSDRPLGEVSEIEGIRLATIGYYSLYRKSVYVNMGTGFWHVAVNDGEDITQLAFRGGFTVKQLGVALFIGGEILKREGPDIFVPQIGVNLLKF